MGQQVYQHTLPNGLVLLAERMEHVRSAAINFLVPAGCAYDPRGQRGVASVLAEMITRGAGDRDSRELSLALDDLGVDRDESVGAINMRFWGSTLARNIPAALDIYADIILRPHLPDDELEPVQALALQDIQSLEDSPQQKVMIELRRRYYPPPLSKDRRGKIEDIEALTPDAVREQYTPALPPERHDPVGRRQHRVGAAQGQVERLFGDWAPRRRPRPDARAARRRSRPTCQKDTQQTQIAFAFPSVPVGHPDYYAARAAEGVLSGGMSARLFTEVREKRGLCYSVGVRHETFKDRGTMVGYAGTGADRAQQTLDVTVARAPPTEGRRRGRRDRPREGRAEVVAHHAGGIDLGPRRVRSRPTGIYLGRVRSFDEIQAAIDGLTPQLRSSTTWTASRSAT